jgi:hypothetical protein
MRAVITTCRRSDRFAPWDRSTRSQRPRRLPAVCWRTQADRNRSAEPGAQVRVLPGAPGILSVTRDDVLASVLTARHRTPTLVTIHQDYWEERGREEWDRTAGEVVC